MTILLTNGLAIVYIVLIYSSSLGFHHFMEGSQKYTLVNSKCVNFLHWNFLEIDYFSSFTESWSCSTHKILECSFPFRHNYTVHYGCLNDQWCATKVLMDSTDEESNVMSIDFCENDCPGSKCIILIFLIDLFNRMCTHQTNIKRNGKITDFDATWAS